MPLATRQRHLFGLCASNFSKLDHPIVIGSVTKLVESVHARTGFRKTFVEQRARYLQAAGRLRVTPGARQPSAVPRDAVNVLFSLAADRARAAPQFAGGFEMLARLGEGCDPLERRAGDYLERLIARIWAGNRDDAGCTVTLWVRPDFQMHVATPPAPRPTRFYPSGNILDFGNAHQTRTGLSLPGTTIAAIGADLGFEECRYAA